MYSVYSCYLNNISGPPATRLVKWRIHCRAEKPSFRPIRLRTVPVSNHCALELSTNKSAPWNCKPIRVQIQLSECSLHYKPITDQEEVISKQRDSKYYFSSNYRLEYQDTCIVRRTYSPEKYYFTTQNIAL